MCAVQKWRPYLVGQTFTIKTDQQSLKFLLEQRIGTPAQQKWLTKLLGYDFSIEYKRGKKNRVADELSRRDKAVEEGVLTTITFPQPVWIEELRQSYVGDPLAQKLITKSQQGRLQGNTVVVRNGIIVKKGRIYVGASPTLKSQLLAHVHACPTTGHSRYHNFT